MCGIVGLARRKQQPDAKTIERMVASVSHRGPDDSGVLVDGSVGLGTARLAIIDTSKNGHMPMIESNESHNDFILSYNGEIYNFEALKNDPALADETFNSESDTEILLKLYKHYGIDESLTKLNGMFAFALLDKQANKLYLARDRLGIKPLYYAKTNDAFIFGSEIRALLASGHVQPKINKSVLGTYLVTGSIPEPDTIIQGASLLPAGSYAAIDLSSWEFTITSYWQLQVSEQITDSYDTIVSRTRELLEASVKHRLVSDVPLGAFLSGGLDSTAIVGLMSKHHSDALKTFSVIFPENQEHSEQSYAQLVAKHFDTDHAEVAVTGADVATQLKHAISAMDQPTIDGINSYFVSKAAHDGGLTVSLSGVGGDELFMGYPTFTRLPKLLNAPILPRTMGKWLFGNQPKLQYITKHPESSLALLYTVFRGVLTPAEAADILDSGQLPKFEIDIRATDMYPSLTELELTRYLRNQLLRDTDVMSMAHSLEVRVPFLDHELVEYLTAVPHKYKLKTGTTKPLLIDAIKDLLPSDIQQRHKQSFAFPMASFLRAHLVSLVQNTVLPLVKTQKLLDPDKATHQWQKFLNGHIHWSRVWVWIALTLWIEEHIGSENLKTQTMQ